MRHRRVYRLDPGLHSLERSVSAMVTYEMHHAATGHGLVFAGDGNGFVYTFISSLWYGLGPGFAFFFAAAVIWALVKRDRPALVILAFAMPDYALISISQVRFARYALPLFPAVGILCGWLMQELYQKLPRRGARPASVAVCSVVFLCTLLYTITLEMPFRQPDPRDVTARWVFANIPKGSSIGMIDAPWFYSPPLSRDLGFGTLGQRQESARRTPYILVVLSDYEKPDSWYTKGSAPQWIILSNYEIEDAERLAGNKSISPQDREQVNRIVAILDVIARHYRAIGGVDQFSRMQLYDLPHDMRYTSPAISVFNLRQ